MSSTERQADEHDGTHSDPFHIRHHQKTPGKETTQNDKHPKWRSSAHPPSEQLTFQDQTHVCHSFASEKSAEAGNGHVMGRAVYIADLAF